MSWKGLETVRKPRRISQVFIQQSHMFEVKWAPIVIDGPLKTGSLRRKQDPEDSDGFGLDKKGPIPVVGAYRAPL